MLVLTPLLMREFTMKIFRKTLGPLVGSRRGGLLLPGPLLPEFLLLGLLLGGSLLGGGLLGGGLMQGAGLQAQEPSKATGDWIPLFNGKDLDDWQVKITGHELGDNFGQTFRVEDGLLKVGYAGYENFDGKFGHIFYKSPFSHYVLRAEYRFVGDQVPGGPGWAVRNSGLMLHCQAPETIAKDQKFPVSIEVQLLGGLGSGPRTTANLCTPGTHVEMDGQLVKRHCTSSRSKTYDGDQWVTVEVEVRGDEIVKHLVDGEVVLQYTRPQLDEQDADARKLIDKAGGSVRLTGGHISLQSESHPVEFRKVELRELPH